MGKVVESLNGNEWQRGCVLEIKERDGVNGVKVYYGLVKMKLVETVEYDLMNDYRNEESDDDDVDGEWRFSLFEDYVAGDLRVIW